MSRESLPRVLLVQREASELDEVADALATGGYGLIRGGSSTEALEHLRSGRIGVTLVDVDLADDPGRLLLAELRLRWPEVVGVVLIRYDSLSSAVDTVNEGACDYVVSPCPAPVLKAAIARAMERAALARALRQGLEDLDDANARLRALSDDLQARVDRATAELREAHAQREVLVSMVAHDLAGPLTSLAGYVELLGRGSLPADRQENARRILASELQRLGRLVADLADASNRGNEFRVDPVACDLALLVREQVDLAQILAPHPIELRLPDGDVVVACDRHRIGQVLSNLIGNAIKYAGNAPIRVELRAEDAQVCVSVRDRGPGIPVASLEAIFESRVRLASEPAGPPGSGLGLHISRRIVAAHGGRIWAESEPGAGSRFVVCLPRSGGRAPTRREQPAHHRDAGQRSLPDEGESR
jgi:signal transduction histidine kinase